WTYPTGWSTHRTTTARTCSSSPGSTRPRRTSRSPTSGTPTGHTCMPRERLRCCSVSSAPPIGKKTSSTPSRAPRVNGLAPSCASWRRIPRSGGPTGPSTARTRTACSGASTTGRRQTPRSNSCLSRSWTEDRPTQRHLRQFDAVSPSTRYIRDDQWCEQQHKHEGRYRIQTRWRTQPPDDTARPTTSQRRPATPFLVVSLPPAETVGLRWEPAPTDRDRDRESANVYKERVLRLSSCTRIGF